MRTRHDRPPPAPPAGAVGWRPAPRAERRLTPSHLLSPAVYAARCHRAVKPAPAPAATASDATGEAAGPWEPTTRALGVVYRRSHRPACCPFYHRCHLRIERRGADAFALRYRRAGEGGGCAAWRAWCSLARERTLVLAAFSHAEIVDDLRYEFALVSARHDRGRLHCRFRVDTQEQLERWTDEINACIGRAGSEHQAGAASARPAVARPQRISRED